MDMTPILIPAGNPSDWTGPTGNNTWLLPRREPALVDAGVGHPEHVEASTQALDGVPLARVLITHWHPDHVKGLPALQERWKGVKVSSGPGGRCRAGDGCWRSCRRPATPRITCASSIPSARDLYCGDLARKRRHDRDPGAQGRGPARCTSRRCGACASSRPRRLLPGHGPIVEDPIALIDEYVAAPRSSASSKS